MTILVEAIQLTETDRRLLIAGAIIFSLAFIIIAAIGALLRFITERLGRRIEREVTDAVRYRILEDEQQFRRYAWIKNGRIFFVESVIPLSVLFVSLIFYLIYATSVDEWTRPYWQEFGTLFYQWDFWNADHYVKFWGLHLLAEWPDLVNTPHFVVEYWPSYILCTLWSIGGTYLLIVGWAYVARALAIWRIAQSVYHKSLEGYNFYDSGYPDADEIQRTKQEMKNEEK